ncbi:MAG TPA: hypothetical protein VF796_06285, partial [Humisphaera sp.]
MRTPFKTAVAALAAASCAVAACDKPGSAGAPADRPTSPATEPSTAPASRPSTRRAARVPSFPPDGTYADAKTVARVTTGRDAVAALLERHGPQLAKGYNDPAAPAALLKAFDAGAAAAGADDRYVGAMLVTGNPPEGASATVYFMSNRSYVEVGRVVLADAARARGEPVAFDPP